MKKDILDGMFDCKFAFQTKSNDMPEGYIAGIATTPKMDSYDDIIAVNAFADSIKDRGVTGPRAIKMLAHHDSRHIIGNWKSIEYVGEQLKVAGIIDISLPMGKQYHEHVKKDQIGSLSVGFRTQIRQYDEDYTVRTIVKGDLREISLVTFPANEDAVIQEVKSADYEKIEKLSDLEKQIARDFGLSRKQSAAMIRVVKASQLLASAPADPAPAGASSDQKAAEIAAARIKQIQETTELLKSMSAIADIRRLTEELNSSRSW